MILGLLQDFSHWILLTLLEDDLFYGHYLILVSGFRNKSWATYFSITNMGHNVIISNWGGAMLTDFGHPPPWLMFIMIMIWETPMELMIQRGVSKFYTISKYAKNSSIYPHNLLHGPQLNDLGDT